MTQSKILFLPGNPGFNAGLQKYFERHYPGQQEFVSVDAGFFANDEPSIQVLENIRRADVFVVQASSGSYPLLNEADLESRVAAVMESWNALSAKEESLPALHRLLFGLAGIEAAGRNLDEDALRVFIARQFKRSVNDDFMQMLATFDALDRAGVHRIVPVIPCFPYARQDRKDKPRVPITARLAADMVQLACGQSYAGIMTSELHAPQEQGFFKRGVDDLPMTWLIAADIMAFLRDKGLTLDDIVLVSPDVGGEKRVEKVADELNASDLEGHCDIAVLKKTRRKGQPPSSRLLHDGETKDVLAGRRVIVIDDMVDSAKSACNAARDLKTEFGAEIVDLWATHAVLTDAALSNIGASRFCQVTVTDTLAVPPQTQTLVKSGKLRVVSAIPYFAEAMQANMHLNGSVSEGSVSELFSVRAINEIYVKAGIPLGGLQL